MSADRCSERHEERRGTQGRQGGDKGGGKSGRHGLYSRGENCQHPVGKIGTHRLLLRMCGNTSPRLKVVGEAQRRVKSHRPAAEERSMRVIDPCDDQ